LTFELCKIGNNSLSLRNCKAPLYYIGHRASDKKFPLPRKILKYQDENIKPDSDPSQRPDTFD